MNGITAGTPAHPGFSDILNLRRYERETRRRLLLGFALAVDALALLFLFCPPLLREAPRPEEEPYRTIIADIIEIPASPPDDPFIVRPPAAPAPYPRHRPFSPAPPRAVPGSGIRELPDVATPRFEREISRAAGEIAEGFSDSLNVDDGTPGGPDGRIPLRRDAGADPGMFKSDIIYNPGNPTAAQGYVHIPLIRFAEPEMKQPETYILSLRGLVAGINRRTNIVALLDNPLSPMKYHSFQIREATNERGIGMDSLFTCRPPLVYLLFDRKPFLNAAEIGSLQRYLMGGGFLVVESARPGNEKLREELRGFLSRVFGSAPVQPIPKSHPVYHCFFDFNEPPEGAGQELGAIPFKVQPHLDGVWIRDTLVGVFSDRGYGLCWAAKGGDYGEQEKMGINLMLYALVRQRERHIPEMKAER